MSNIKRGDRIKISDNHTSIYHVNGKTGIVLCEYKNDYLVKIDNFHGGHNGSGKERDIDGTYITGGHCLYIDKVFVKKISPETIVIYRKDRQVIALDKSTRKKAIARCNPSDEFCFNTGAKLAFERLMSSNPKDDIGLNEDAKKLYELYKSLKDAGFTLTEAIQLVANMLFGGKK